MKPHWIILFLLFGCSINNDKKEYEIIKETISWIDGQNHKRVNYLERVSADEGYKNQKLVDDLKRLITFRMKSNTDSNLLNYSILLRQEYQRDLFLDSANLKNLDLAINNYKTDNDSLNYYSLQLKLLLIEQETIRGKGMRMGSSGWYNAIVSRSQDSFIPNKEISIAVYPEDQLRIKKEVPVLIFHNGVLQKIPIKIETIGSVAIIKFTPNLVGEYKIEGELLIESDYDYCISRYKFADFIKVKK